MRVYVDSSALLKRIFAEDGSAATTACLEQYDRDGAALVSSSLAWVEVSRAVRSYAKVSPVIQIDELVDVALSGILEKQISPEVVALARRIHPSVLGSLDAIHLASALLVDADLILTFDQRLVKAAAHHAIKALSPSTSPNQGDAAVSEQFDQEFWDERYRSHPHLWSGDPNPHLVATAGDLQPGAALDVGAGEGTDAIWLATRQWQVTAVDVSSVALGRAAGHAGEQGGDLSARIEWLHRDIRQWSPPASHYDLVSSQYVHLPSGSRQALFDRLAAAVAPGGTLLIVGHHPSDLGVIPRPPDPDLFFTGDDV
ncbi:MAG: methyltransferase domain-containing protein, partial [Acidimicrobiales bacterium]